MLDCNARAPTLYHATLSPPSSLTLTRMSDNTSELADGQSGWSSSPQLPLAYLWMTYLRS